MSAAAPRRAAGGVDATAFRRALGRFATGVAFVTTTVDGAPLGLVVNSLTSVSLAPPLIAFSPSRSSLTWRRMRTAGRLAINVLAADHAGFVREVAPAGADRFAAGAYDLSRGGLPVLRDALAVIDCVITAEHPAGDHTIVVAEVTDVAMAEPAAPLVFWAGTLGSFA